MQKVVLTDIRHSPRRKIAAITLQGLGRFFYENNYVFNTPDLSAKQMERIREGIKNNPQLKNFKQTPKDKVYNILQVELPYHAKQALPSNFIDPHYNEQLRWYVSEPGTWIDVGDDLLDDILMKEEFNRQLKNIREKIGEEIDAKSKAAGTRVFNKLNEMFFENKQEQIKTDNSTKNLSDSIIDQRKRIHESYEQLKLRRKVEFHDKKKELELIVSSSTPIKRDRQLNYGELMQQKWLFVDIEKPHFVDEKGRFKREPHQKEEVSWVGLSYYEKGTFYKELHTLSDVGLEQVDGFRIIKHDSEEQLLDGVTKSIQKQNPYFVSAYNSQFDLIQMRDSSEKYKKKFAIGENDTRPRKEVTITIPDKENPGKRKKVPFATRIGIEGKQSIDLLAWSRLVYPFLNDHTLETTAIHMFGEKEFEKSINYEELANLEEDARYAKVRPNLTIEERISAAQKIANYSAKDVDIIGKIMLHDDFQRTLHLASEIGDEFRIPVAKLMQYASAIDESQDRAYFDVVGISRDEIFREDKEEDRDERRKARALFGRMTNDSKEYGHKLYKLIERRFPDVLNISEREKPSDGRAEFSYCEKTFLSRMENAVADYLVIEYGILNKRENDFKKMLSERDDIESKLEIFRDKNELDTLNRDIEKQEEKLIKQYKKIIGNFDVRPEEIDRALGIEPRKYLYHGLEPAAVRKFSKLTNPTYEETERFAIYLDGLNTEERRTLTRRYPSLVGGYAVK